MPFQAGEQWNGNASGRKPGSKNKIGKDFQSAYEEAKEKYKHPYLLMMEWAHDESKPLEVRAAMIKEAASYTCVKPKQTIGIQPTVPVFQTEDQAEQFLAEFISAIAPDLEPAELATITRQWISSKREGQELQLKHAPQLPQRIIIENSPGLMPGHEGVVMPKFNQETNGHTLDLEKNVGPELPAPAADDQSSSQDPGP